MHIHRVSSALDGSVRPGGLLLTLVLSTDEKKLCLGYGLYHHLCDSNRVTVVNVDSNFSVAIHQHNFPLEGGYSASSSGFTKLSQPTYLDLFDQ